MEILNTAPVTIIAPWTMLCAVIGTICIVLTVSFLTDEKLISAAVTASLALIAMIIIVACPRELPTERQTYVVEITDDSYFSELISHNFTLKRLYDNRNIYEIEGIPYDGLTKGVE